MAAPRGAGQYEDAFSPQRLQNWTVPRPGRQHPFPRERSTLIIANDRGHLLPTVPRCQASPWGTFVGTWEMPLRIPPARLDLTSRSAAAAAQLLDQIHRPTALTHACNGLQTQVTGKPGGRCRWSDTPTAAEPSQGSSGAPSKDAGEPRTPATNSPSSREARSQEALPGSAPSREESGERLSSRRADPSSSGHHEERPVPQA